MPTRTKDFTAFDNLIGKVLSVSKEELKRRVRFVGVGTVLAVGDHPHGGKPLIKADSGILEDGPDLDRKLRLRMPSLALPKATGRKKRHPIRTAGGARHLAVFPAPCGQKVQAIVRIGEVQNRFLKGDWFGCHEPILRQVA